MKKYIIAPEYSVEAARLPSDNCLFLAGSITGATDWQSEIIKLKPYGREETILDAFHVFNPRRSEFDITQLKVEEEQITWEFHCLEQCKNVLFWFAAETLAPITLFEFGWILGKYSKEKNIFVGIDREYKRRNDVLIQTILRDRGIHEKIVFDMTELVQRVFQQKYVDEQRKKLL